MTEPTAPLSLPPPCRQARSRFQGLSPPPSVLFLKKESNVILISRPMSFISSKQKPSRSYFLEANEQRSFKYFQCSRSLFFLCVERNTEGETLPLESAGPQHGIAPSAPRIPQPRAFVSPRTFIMITRSPWTCTFIKETGLYWDPIMSHRSALGQSWDPAPSLLQEAHQNENETPCGVSGCFLTLWGQKPRRISTEETDPSQPRGEAVPGANAVRNSIEVCAAKNPSHSLQIWGEKPNLSKPDANRAPPCAHRSFLPWLLWSPSLSLRLNLF